MIERFKTVVLIGLILLSIYLTYIIWFGSPYLEEGMLPRFEYAYFTPLPAPEVLLPPTAAILEKADAEAIYYFRRGTRELDAIWKESFRFLSRTLPVALGERPGETEIEKILQESSFKLMFLFNPPLPESFLWGRTAFPGELLNISLIKSEGNNFALLEGEDKVLYRLNGHEEIYFEELFAAFTNNKGLRADRLPEHFMLQAIHPLDGSSEVSIFLPSPESGEQEDEEEEAAADESGGVSGNKEAEAPDQADHTPETVPAVKEESIAEDEADDPAFTDLPSQSDGNEKEDDTQPVDEPTLENWTITVRNNIYIPLIIEAREISLIQEELPRKDLVNAFFLDPAMARRIEERDGAIYYTDGKKGLRLYAGGAVEYTAPGLDVFNNRLSYSSALLQAAENQCLYGGWPTSAFLEKREKTSAGYRFFWRSYMHGLPLIIEDSSCEMVVNDKGMPYYRRNFFTFSGDIRGATLPFSNYDEALFQVISMHREYFAHAEATLLGIRPVYRIKTDTVSGLKAVPAWSVNFAETGTVYLHWYTLEPL